MNNTNKIFAKNLEHYMELKGINRRDLANALDFPYSTLSEWLQGKKIPRMDRIQKLAEYFGTSYSDLFSENQKSTLAIPEDNKGKTIKEIIEILQTFDESMLDLVDDFLSFLVEAKRKAES